MEKNMGDRGNILVVDEFIELSGARRTSSTVFIYSHNHGSHLQKLLKLALSSFVRWDDAAYLTRLIVDTVSDNVGNKVTGLGISSTLGDNEWGRPVLVVRPHYQTVGLWFTELELESYLDMEGSLARGATFKEFVDPTFKFYERVSS